MKINPLKISKSLHLPALFLISAIIAICAVTNFGQKKTLTQQEFVELFQKAMVKQTETNRRNVFKRKTFSNGKLVEVRTVIGENILPDNSRSVMTLAAKGKVSKIEIIQIGGQIYRRESGGEWKKIDSYDDNLFGSSIGKTAYETIQTIYTIEDEKLTAGKKNTIIGWYATYREKNGSPEAKKIIYFHQTKSWIDSDGRFVKGEEIYGQEKSNVVTVYETSTTEYNPKLKIEAPIK